MLNKSNNLYEFGDYLLDSQKRVLWRSEELIALPPKVFDTLCVLVERRGDVVTKDEIFELVWADTFVEENNLSQNIFTLRRTLDTDENENSIIETIPRKGFRITEKIRIIEKPEGERSTLEKTPAKGIKTNRHQDIVIATETETRIVEEIILDDEQGEKVLALEGKQNNFFASNRKWVLPVLGLILISTLGFASYSFYKHYQSDIAKSSFENLSIQSLTNTGDVDLPTLSPDGKFALYLKRFGDEEVFQLRDIELGTVTDLEIEGSIKPGFSRFSNDGKWIYFRKGKGGDFSGKIYKVSYLGGMPELVAENVWGFFSFSHDGELISFFRRKPSENRYDVIVKNLKTEKEQIVLTRFVPQLFFIWSYPSFSPDGKKIAVIQRDQNQVTSKLIIADVASKKDEVFKTPKLVAFRRIEWVSDNKILAIARARKQVPQIHRILYPSGKSTPITRDLKTYRSLSVSSDRKTILSKTVETISNIRVLPNASLENEKKFAEDNFGRNGFFGIRWTPDDKIIYVSRIDRNRNLWKLDPEDESRQQLTKDSGDVNHLPSISNDGKYIYFNSDRSGKMKIWRIDKNGKNPIQISKDEKMQELSPNVSSDGKWLYFIKRSKKSSTIWRKSLTDEKEEQISIEGVSTENHLSLSPNEKYLAFTFFDQKGNQDVQDDETNTGEKLGIIDLENNGKFHSFDVTAFKRSIRWSSNQENFDYIENSPDGSKIWRQSVIDKDSKPKLLLELPKENIFNFDWSSDGNNLAIAVGKNQQDAVIIKLK
jgi:DNA-binding winged helix-turn-helix (wHTH) protein/Tol biopolymer transport system component